MSATTYTKWIAATGCGKWHGGGVRVDCVITDPPYLIEYATHRRQDKSAITRIADKFNRVKNLAKLPPDRQRVKSESITDTLLDMANYCIMTVIEIENQNKQGGANNE